MMQERLNDESDTQRTNRKTIRWMEIPDRGHRRRQPALKVSYPHLIRNFR